jgi:hypothetical protein
LSWRNSVFDETLWFRPKIFRTLFILEFRTNFHPKTVDKHLAVNF